MSKHISFILLIVFLQSLIYRGDKHGFVPDQILARNGKRFSPMNAYIHLFQGLIGEKQKTLETSNKFFLKIPLMNSPFHWIILLKIKIYFPVFFKAPVHEKKILSSFFFYLLSKTLMAIVSLSLFFFFLPSFPPLSQ